MTVKFPVLVKAACENHFVVCVATPNRTDYYITHYNLGDVDCVAFLDKVTLESVMSGDDPVFVDVTNAVKILAHNMSLDGEITKGMITSACELILEEACDVKEESCCCGGDCDVEIDEYMEELYGNNDAWHDDNCINSIGITGVNELLHQHHEGLISLTELVVTCEQQGLVIVNMDTCSMCVEVIPFNSIDKPLSVIVKMQ